MDVDWLHYLEHWLLGSCLVRDFFFCSWAVKENVLFEFYVLHTDSRSTLSGSGTVDSAFTSWLREGGVTNRGWWSTYYLGKLLWLKVLMNKSVSMPIRLIEIDMYTMVVFGYNVARALACLRFVRIAFLFCATSDDSHIFPEFERSVWAIFARARENQRRCN